MAMAVLTYIDDIVINPSEDVEDRYQYCGLFVVKMKGTSEEIRRKAEALADFCLNNRSDLPERSIAEPPVSPINSMISMNDRAANDIIVQELTNTRQDVIERTISGFNTNSITAFESLFHSHDVADDNNGKTEDIESENNNDDEQSHNEESDEWTLQGWDHSKNLEVD